MVTRCILPNVDLHHFTYTELFNWPILSPAQVTEESSQAQFLIPVSARGQNRAQASLERAQALNPMVEVKADTQNVETKPDEFFLKFDAVSELCHEISLVISLFILWRQFACFEWKG